MISNSKLVVMNYEFGVGIFDPSNSTVKWVETGRTFPISFETLSSSRGFSLLKKEEENLIVEVEEMSTSALRERISALTNVKDTTKKRGMYTTKKKKETEFASLVAKALAQAKEMGLLPDSKEEEENGD